MTGVDHDKIILLSTAPHSNHPNVRYKLLFMMVVMHFVLCWKYGCAQAGMAI